MSAAVSRPKIHRLPPQTRFRRERQLAHTILNYGSTTKLALGLSGLMLAVVFSVFIASRFIPANVGKLTGNKDASIFLSSPISDAMASQPAMVSSKTIVLKDQNNMIIGQMSKDPVSRSADVKSTSIDGKRRSERNTR